MTKTNTIKGNSLILDFIEDSNTYIEIKLLDWRDK
jgi:hypothetical protein